ncbi:MAG: rRNA maturation RNase YbeY [Acidimicrobiales bacterium]|nr:rRNA maturation RNase YbeY [Acidimicrobiales bacterium]
MREEPPEPRPRVVVDARTMTTADGVSGDTSRWVALAEHVLVDEGLGARPIELTVHMVDEESITDLNREHMGVDGPTDVLAFPVDDPAEVPGDLPVLLGDVVICPAVAAGQAQGVDGGLQWEMSLLLVHGILHLLGHDHAEHEEREVMQRRERELLAGFGF